MADGNSVLAQAVQVEIIGLNIKTCLDLKGKTYQWLSEQTLIPATVLHDYSEGEGRISPERIATIAKTLSLAQEVLIHDFSETDRVDVIRKAVHGEHYVLETDTLTAIGAKSAAGVIQP